MQWRHDHDVSLAVRIHSDGCWFCSLKQVSIIILLSAKSLFTYLLLQEWLHPGNFDIISKLGIGRREFLILAGKFQLVDSLWGKQVPHYKHKRRSIIYLLREIPVKNRESWSRGQHTGKYSGKFFCLIFCLFVSDSPFKCNIVFGLSLSLSLSVSQSLSLSLSISLSPSLSLSLINNYIHAYTCLTVGRQSRDHRPLSRDPSVTFYKKFPNCLKRPKTLFDSRPDGRVTSDHYRVTVQRLFSKKFLIAWNVGKTLFDSRPTVAWPPTTVAWPFSDFFHIFF